MIDLSIIEADARDAASAGNTEWQLDAEGLEHRATGYFIARAALGARRPDGLWEWPLHMAEKSWCAPRAFHAAFLAALDRFGIERDALLGRSFDAGFEIGSAATPQAEFVALGEIVRPKPAQSKPVRATPIERKRPTVSERSVARSRMTERGRVAVGARA